jgi:hypothetical protein
MNIQAVTGIFSGVPVEWLVLGLCLIILTGLTMMQGSVYTTALALALPVVSVLYGGITHTAILGTISKQFSSSVEQAVLLAILTAVIYVCMYRICATFDHSAGFFVSLICAVAATIVLIIVWVQIPLLESFWQLGPTVQTIFGDGYRLFWLIGAYLALAFARG